MIKKLSSIVLIGILALGLVACGGKEKVKDVPLSEIHEAVKAAYGDNYIPSMEYDTASIEEIFGIKEEWYDDIIAEGPLMSVHVDTFVAVKASDGNEDNVKSALDNYRDNLINNTLQYPMNIGKIQGSQVVQYDNYVFFLQLGVIPDEVLDQDEEAVVEAAKEQNQIAIDAIEKLLK